MITETVLITGSSQGIGLEIARKFASKGHNVILNCANDKELLNSRVNELRETNKNVAGILADVSNFNQVKDMFASIPTTFGHVSVLINNAAVSYVGLFTDMTPNDWRFVIDVNLLSVFNCCHAAVPDMVRRQKGAIINISSIWGESGASCETVYAASKGGLNSFSKSLAKELAPSNIRVNAVACGVINTSMNNFLSAEEKTVLAESIPMGRFGCTKEIADVVYFLSSESAAYLTGQIITVDGGMC